jgi:hypothetical protein
MKTANILILTPVKDAEQFLENYFKQLYQLTYPHALISVALLESDSSDHSYPLLVHELPKLRENFRSVSVWKKDFGVHVAAEVPRWAPPIQLDRRSVLAKSRNHLLFHALDEEDWVLWLDVDVVEFPPDIIERLLGVGKDIVQPNCVLAYGDKSFDRNAWRDGGRYHLHDLREEGDVVRLDAVGGSMLLVRADIHRDGLIFPPFPYGRASPLIRKKRNKFTKNLGVMAKSSLKTGRTIKAMKAMKKADLETLLDSYAGETETEGFGIMAHDMGYDCWGLPNLEIKHSVL